MIADVKIEGSVRIGGVDLYQGDLDAEALRKKVGMVFQQPNPFPKTVYDNVAYGPRIHGITKKAELDGIVEQSLRGAALWDEVKDHLKRSAYSLRITSYNVCYTKLLRRLRMRKRKRLRLPELNISN